MSRYGDRFTEHSEAALFRSELCKDLRARPDWQAVRSYANHVAGHRVIDVLNLVQHELAAAQKFVEDDPGGHDHGVRVYLTSPEQVLEDMRDRVIDLLGEEGAEAHEATGAAS